MSPGLDMDIAIVGGGGAGLSLVLHLDALLAAHPELPVPRIALVDPVVRTGADRTWCYWDACAPTDHPLHPGPGGLDPVTAPIEPAVYRAWRRGEVIDAAGVRTNLQLNRLRYVMVRSQDFYPVAQAALDRLGVTRIQSRAQVSDGERCATVQAGDLSIRAEWVFDSRPTAPVVPARTQLLLHFRGWTLTFDQDVLDPHTPTIMDFTTPQPGDGVSFMYCLPLSERQALIEYNEFSPQRLPDAAYDEALRAHLEERYPGVGYTIEAVEDDVLPLSDARFSTRAGLRLRRIGTAGGASRGSTGYAFAGIQRQVHAVATALIAGREPVVPPAYPARHLWLDAVLLRALVQGKTDRAALYSRLFAKVPADRLLRFLDGQTSMAEELTVMAASPIIPMTSALLADAGARLCRS